MSDRIDITPGAPAGDDARVILLADARVRYHGGVNVDLDAGASLELPRAQAERLIASGIARRPGRPAEPSS